MKNFCGIDAGTGSVKVKTGYTAEFVRHGRWL